MSSIKIFVTHTPNKDNQMITDDIFQNVVAGAFYHKGDLPRGVLGDNTGDNISEKNKSYCELTTQYWAWKNTDYDYYGFCHYRRFFSFSKEALKETQWGTVECEYLSEATQKKLCLNRKSVEKYVEGYDFLIAKAIPTKQLGAKTIRKHYDNARELYVKDFDCMMDIIREKYPDIYPWAEKYSKGGVSYPCNMFIMKKAIFQEYNEFLFDVLDEFEKRTDLTRYCVQSLRVTGHLAERLLGIYYLYLQGQNKYKLDEIQIALIHHTEKTQEITPQAPDEIPIVLAANDYYSPIIASCLRSIVAHMSAEHIYHIVIFHTDITDENKKKIMMSIPDVKNMKVDFLNIGRYVDGYNLCGRMHITVETYYRFLILDIMKQYQKVLYLDCDLIVRADLAELYDVDLKKNLLGAVRDPDFTGQLNIPGFDTMEYCVETMKMRNPYDYFQAGVLVLNIVEMRKITTVEKLLDIAEQNLYRYSDQDILNILCEGRVTYLDMAWNHIHDCNRERIKNTVEWAPAQIRDAYMEARKAPKIIHYAGFVKPWISPREEFSEDFWAAARETVFYELLIYRMQEGLTNYILSCKPKKLSLKSRFLYLILPAGSSRRDKARAMWYKLTGRK